MAVVMLDEHVQNQRANIGIIGGSLAVFAMALWLGRSQATVGDASYLRAMIPHHSIAIQTGERARITDSRVRTLADQIIESQRREIEAIRPATRLVPNPERSSPARGHRWPRQGHIPSHS